MLVWDILTQVLVNVIFGNTFFHRICDAFVHSFDILVLWYTIQHPFRIHIYEAMYDFVVLAICPKQCHGKDLLLIAGGNALVYVQNILILRIDLVQKAVNIVSSFFGWDNVGITTLVDDPPPERDEMSGDQDSTVYMNYLPLLEQPNSQEVILGAAKVHLLSPEVAPVCKIECCNFSHLRRLKGGECELAILMLVSWSGNRLKRDSERKGRGKA